MPSTTHLGPAAAGPSGAPAARRRRVIDAPTRAFHWLFALSFAGAYLTADGERWRALHVTLGYALAGLLVFRLLYGLFGPRQARLGPMFRRLGGAGAWLRSTLQAAAPGAAGRIDWRRGQNLALAIAVVALLVLAAPLTLSGYGTYAEWGGGFGGEALEELHEFLGEAMLAIVLAHVALIVVLSVHRGRNQALPMLTGHTDGPGPDLARRNHAVLAALLWLAAAAFVAWQWQQAPNGLIPASGAAQAAAGRVHDEDD